MLRPLAVALLLCTSTVGLHAQAAHEHTGPAPERLGHVEFASGCDTRVQARFERGVALLHSFWYEEAGRAFGEVAAADSGCALAYWGQAMSVLHPLWTPPKPEERDAGPGRRRARGAASAGPAPGRATMPRPSRHTIEATRSTTVPG